MEQFEDYAFDRLKVLRTIEQFKVNGHSDTACSRLTHYPVLGEGVEA